MQLLRQYGPWTTFKTIELHHDEPYQGVDVSVCLDNITKHGFHLTAQFDGVMRSQLQDCQTTRRGILACSQAN